MQEGNRPRGDDGEERGGSEEGKTCCLQVVGIRFTTEVKGEIIILFGESLSYFSIVASL